MVHLQRLVMWTIVLHLILTLVLESLAVVHLGWLNIVCTFLIYLNLCTAICRAVRIELIMFLITSGPISSMLNDRVCRHQNVVYVLSLILLMGIWVLESASNLGLWIIFEESEKLLWFEIVVWRLLFFNVLFINGFNIFILRIAIIIF